MLHVENKRNEGVLLAWSRLENKEKKRNIKRCVGLVAWWAGLRGLGPTNEINKKKFKVSLLSSNLGLRGPLGHGGPRSKFRESSFGPIILVTNLGNFRRLRNYINSVR